MPSDLARQLLPDHLQGDRFLGVRSLLGYPRSNCLRAHRLPGAQTPMKFIFIDEIEQSHKKPGFFAVSSLVVNSRFYEVLKDAVDEALEQAKWSREEEFKGRYIFSSSKGDTRVPVESRIELVRSLVAETTAKRRTRGRAATSLTTNTERRLTTTSDWSPRRWSAARLQFIPDFFGSAKTSGWQR